MYGSAAEMSRAVSKASDESVVAVVAKGKPLGRSAAL
jgi:hypothetical protein